jgi:transglutaminase-like putative cysteine protease
MTPPARHVGAYLEIDVISQTRLVFQLAAARDPDQNLDESMSITVDGRPVQPTVVEVSNGGMLHVVTSAPGAMVVDYQATVDGSGTSPVDVSDEYVYARASRYAESDRLLAVAFAEFSGTTGSPDLLAAVSSWVGSQLSYMPGSSGPTDGAVDTLLGRQGVCRDYAHLCIALLRAMNVPARLAAVYAPGLSPMDFHAVAEALVDGQWRVVDATLLAPRRSLVRIATGRDAADTAFMSTFGGSAILHQAIITATTDGNLPVEDVLALVTLG